MNSLVGLKMLKFVTSDLPVETVQVLEAELNQMQIEKERLGWTEQRLVNCMQHLNLLQDILYMWGTFIRSCKLLFCLSGFHFQFLNCMFSLYCSFLFDFLFITCTVYHLLYGFLDFVSFQPASRFFPLFSFKRLIKQFLRYNFSFLRYDFYVFFLILLQVLFANFLSYVSLFTKQHQNLNE